MSEGEVSGQWESQLKSKEARDRGNVLPITRNKVGAKQKEELLRKVTNEIFWRQRLRGGART